MGMGWNLLGGALAGLGNGMVQNADAEQKRVAAEALAMKEQALARLNSELTMQRNEADYRMKAPEREFNQNLQTRGLDNMERATTANIDSQQRNYELNRDQLDETARHNKEMEKNAANNTEARITIAEMQAENRRMRQAAIDLEKQAQLPKEQIEYLKGFSASRTKILSDTLMPESEKKSALASLDADLYANYPPKILRDNKTGMYQTQDVLGRTRNFKNVDELKAAGFPAVGDAAGGSPPPNPAPAPTANPRPSNIFTGDYQAPADSPAGKRAARIALQQEGERASQENVRNMVQQNASTYSPEQAQQILDAYGSMLSPKELVLLQNRIRSASFNLMQ